MAQKDEELKPYVYTKHTYDPFDATKNTAIVDANGKATTANQAYTDYIKQGFKWDKQDDYNTAYGDYDNWLNTKFNYDFNADALYQQYKDKYIQQGKMAMQDTMGQAAALTGGYGNSYASTVGNQAYQASLQNLNDVIPELYQMAYSMHQNKGQNMLNQLGLLESDRNYEYGVWSDKGNMLNADRTYYQTEADNLFNREYGMWDADRTYDQTEHHNSENMLYQASRDAVADAQFERQMALEENKFRADTEDDYKSPYAPEKEKEEEDPEPTIKPYTKEYYADWDALEWESYFAEIRNDPKGGGSAEAIAELNKLNKLGCIPTNMMVYASLGARGKLGH